LLQGIDLLISSFPELGILLKSSILMHGHMERLQEIVRSSLDGPQFGFNCDFGGIQGDDCAGKYRLIGRCFESGSGPFN
jgi:hypothetical protein